MVRLRAAEMLKECLRVTSKLMFPFKEDLVRFDFEVQAEDEWMCDFLVEGTRG